MSTMTTPRAVSVTVGIDQEPSAPERVATSFDCPHCGGSIRGQRPLTLEEQAEYAVRLSRRERLDRKMKRLHSIASAVAEFYAITTAEMQQRSRDWEFLLPRQMAMYLMKASDADVSWSDIARVFSRDHSTVIHSVRIVERQRKTELWLREDMATLSGLLGITA